MTLTLAKLRKKVHEVAVPIGDDGDAITVQFSTWNLTPRVQQDIARAVAEATDDDPLPGIRQFLTVVTGWDFAADDGEPPIPLTEAALLDVPTEIIGSVLLGVTTAMQDLAPKGATGTSSNGPSSAPPITS